MKILFLSLIDFDDIEEHNIYTDLLRKIHIEGHSVYVISPVERKKNVQTSLKSIDDRLQILKLKIGNIQKTNIIEKGISTLLIEGQFIRGIKKYFSAERFDLILYTTPPITLQRAVQYVKRRDGAITYLMLKDIFPQNAVDLGMLKKTGMKGYLYHYFRKKEKKLYRYSDYIGCMSQANVDYIRLNNLELDEKKIEVCPNCIEPNNPQLNEDERLNIRKRYGIPENVKAFIYGGNLGKPQGISFMLECLSVVKNRTDIFIMIVGNGTEYKKIETYLEKNGNRNVKLIQYLPKKKYDRLVCACDVGLIFLDYRFTIPNFPSRLLAYLDASIPVFAVTDENTDMSKIIVENKMGWWCPSNDKRKFTEIVDEIMDADTSAMGENGKQFLNNNYSEKQIYKTIIKHISGEERKENE